VLNESVHFKQFGEEDYCSPTLLICTGYYWLCTLHLWNYCILQWKV